MVEPLLTRFIRIYPERATPAGMGLRLELLGCEIEGIKSVCRNDCLGFGAKLADLATRGDNISAGDINISRSHVTICIVTFKKKQRIQTRI